MAGTVKEEFAVPPGGTELEWCGPDYMRSGPTLFDLKLKWPIATYTLPGQGRMASRSPDSRLWFAASRDANGPPLLMAQTLPDATTRQLARQAAAGNAKIVLAPGMAVKVSVQGAAPPGADANTYHRDIANRQAQHLLSLGFNTGADSPLTLTIQFQPAHNTGQVRRYKSFGRLKQDVSINVIEVTAVAKLSDATGATVWTVKNTFRTPDVAVVNGADNLQNALDKQVWSTWRAGPARRRRRRSCFVPAPVW